MIYTGFEKKIENIKSTLYVGNDNTCIVLEMKATLCFDNIIMMSSFVELCHDIIENWRNFCFDFLSCYEINTLKSVWYWQQELL